MVIRRLRPTLGEDDKLISSIYERHPGATAMQLHLKETLIELQSLLDIPTSRATWLNPTNLARCTLPSILRHPRRLLARAGKTARVAFRTTLWRLYDMLCHRGQELLQPLLDEQERP